MSQIKTSFALVFVVGAVTACSGYTSHNQIGDSNLSGLSTSGPTFVNIGPLVTAAELQGSWQGNCGVSYDNNAATEQFTLNFDNAGGATYTVNSYSGSSCSGPQLISLTFSGSYTLGALDGKIQGATDITFALNSASMSPESDAATASMNSSALCGLTNWQTGVAQSINLSNSCIGAVAVVTGPQIISISSGELYFGNSDNSALNLTSGYEAISTSPN